MGYSVFAYYVLAEEICRVAGSGDKQVLSGLIDKYRIDLRDKNELFELSEPVTAEAILKDIIYGEVNYDNVNHVYGYMYELLCMALGKDQISYHLSI